MHSELAVAGKSRYGPGAKMDYAPVLLHSNYSGAVCSWQNEQTDTHIHPLRDNCSFMGAIGMHCAHECCNHSITICWPPTAPTKVSWAQCMYVCMCSLQLEISGRSSAVIHKSLFFSAQEYYVNSQAAVEVTLHRPWERSQSRRTQIGLQHANSLWVITTAPSLPSPASLQQELLSKTPPPWLQPRAAACQQKQV